MSHRDIFFLFAVGLTVLFNSSDMVAGQDRNKKALGQEINRLQGEWTVDTQESGGKPIIDESDLPIFIALAIKDHNCSISFKRSGNTDTEHVSTHIKLAESAMQQQIDLQSSDGIKTRFRGIYKFTEKKELLISLAIKEGDRPIGFDTSKEAIILLTLRRNMK